MAGKRSVKLGFVKSIVFVYYAYMKKVPAFSDYIMLLDVLSVQSGIVFGIKALYKTLNTGDVGCRENGVKSNVFRAIICFVIVDVYAFEHTMPFVYAFI